MKPNYKHAAMLLVALAAGMIFTTHSFGQTQFKNHKNWQKGKYAHNALRWQQYNRHSHGKKFYGSHYKSGFHGYQNHWKYKGKYQYAYPFKNKTFNHQKQHGQWNRGNSWR